MNRNKENVSKYDYIYQTKNYYSYKMGAVKEIDTKNRTYYFYKDMINIKNFDPNLLKIDKNHTKTLVFTTLDILQLKKNDDYENIYNVNPLYLVVKDANGYIEERGVNKYLIFDSTGENK